MKRSVGLSLQVLLSLAAAALPKAWLARWRENLDTDSQLIVVLSSLMQLAVFAAVFVVGFFSYMNELFATSAGMMESSLLALTPLTPFIYALTTLTGAVGAVGTMGAAGRLIHLGVMGRGAADPTLATLEALRSALTHKGQDHLRETSKGDRVSDHIVTAGADSPWQLRITTCDELDWHEGCPVLALGTFYRVLSTRDVKDERGRLRIVHELRAMPAAEGAGGFRRYEPRTKPVMVAARPLSPPVKQATGESPGIPLSTDAPAGTRQGPGSA